MKLKTSKLIALSLILNPLKIFAQDSSVNIALIISNLRSAKHDPTLREHSDRIQIIERLSNEEKDEIIIKLLNESERDLIFENNHRLENIDYKRDVGARSFRE